jgi:hypothetical protein
MYRVSRYFQYAFCLALLFGYAVLQGFCVQSALFPIRHQLYAGQVSSYTNEMPFGQKSLPCCAFRCGFALFASRLYLLSVRFVLLRRMSGDAARKKHLTGHGRTAHIEPVLNGHKLRQREFFSGGTC